jgi:hypothetical protein
MSFLAKAFGRRRPSRPPAPPTPQTTPRTFPNPTLQGPEGVLHIPGPFIFPDYQTQGVRLTTGYENLFPVGMAYWNNINAHLAEPHLYVILGMRRGEVGLWKVDKTTLEVTDLGPFRRGTGEGWYFSKVDPHLLHLVEGPRLLTRHILTGEERTLLDISDTHPGCTLFQPHSSRDGTAHSATVKDANYEDLGCVALSHGRLSFFGREGAYDECKIDKSGEWLLIEQNNDNKIIHLATGDVLSIPDQGLALSHCDTGFGYAIGEENYSDPGGVFRRWNFLPGQLPQDGGVIFSMDWTPMSRYVSHCNAPQSSVLITTPHELIAVDLTTLARRPVAPTLGDPSPSGSSDYDLKPKANLDPPGQWACWTTGTPLVAYLVRVG